MKDPEKQAIEAAVHLDRMLTLIWERLPDEWKNNPKVHEARVWALNFHFGTEDEAVP